MDADADVDVDAPVDETANANVDADDNADKAEQAELDAEVLRKVQHDDMCCDVVAELLRVAPDKTLPHKTILADNMVLHHLSHGGTTKLERWQLSFQLIWCCPDVRDAR